MANFTTLVQQQAQQHPDRVALSLPDYRRLRDGRTAERLTFGALWQRVSSCARQLEAMGVRRGHRVLVLVPLSSDLYVVALAVMSLGGFVVLVDAGFGRKQLADTVDRARIDAVVSIKRTLRYRLIAPFLRRIPLKAALDGSGWGVRRLDVQRDLGPFEPLLLEAETGALMTCTSGSTGRPKVAVRTHWMLVHQHLALEEAFPPPEDEVALTCFPVAVLHHLCCGTPSVLPALDLKDVAAVVPEWILEQIAAEGVTALTAAPAFFRAFTRHCLDADLQLEEIERLGVGGAPVDESLCEAIAKVFPRAEAVIIYGSTEAEPVASIPVDEVRALAAGAPLPGYPAGYVHASAAVRLVRPAAGPLILSEGETLAERDVAPGAWGEVLVSGAHVNTGYFEDPEADRVHKVRDETGRIWHRMGDAACRDAAGRLWLGGRAAQLIHQGPQVAAPFQAELLLQRVPGLGRVAFHQHGGRLLLWVEGEMPSEETRQEIERVLSEIPLTPDEIRAYPTLPVDARHRSKIDYAALDHLAAQHPQRRREATDFFRETEHGSV